MGQKGDETPYRSHAGLIAERSFFAGRLSEAGRTKANAQQALLPEERRKDEKGT